MAENALAALAARSIVPTSTATPGCTSAASPPEHRNRLRRAVHHLATVQHASRRLCSAMFVVKAGGVSRLLQTAGGPNWPRVKRIEMTGEYPIATLRYIDSDLPVKVGLSAFTPFAPLDAKFSSQPLAALVFRVENPTAEDADSLAGRDDAECGGLRRHRPDGEPKFGGNVNEPFVDGSATGLLMRAEPGKGPTIDRPMAIFAAEEFAGPSRPAGTAE